MASQIAFDLNLKTNGTGPGTAFDVRCMRGRLVHLWGVFTATFQVEGSLDGTNWTLISTAFAANTGGFKLVDDGWNFIRLNTTAWTSFTSGGARVGGFI